MDRHFETIIIGAGAAGLFCGAHAGRSGASVLVLDHSAKPAEKVRISGGGRCNFTNLETSSKQFLSQNPHFTKSALARYTPWHFCDLMAEHNLSWSEKTLGQLFCDQRSAAVIKLLLDELERAGAELALSCAVNEITHHDGRFHLTTSSGAMDCRHLVIATGGLSIPKMGATSFAYDIARQFGHEIITPRPALVPLTFSGVLKEDFASLSGISTDVTVSAGNARFSEAMLFTHRGLSGPAILQASSYWQEGEPISVRLMAQSDPLSMLKDARQAHPKRSLAASLGEHLPRRLVDLLTQRKILPPAARMGELSNSALHDISHALMHWEFKPTGTEGWRTAEVTAGGVATDRLSSKNLESQMVPGLFFIGECLDVTGWLGGYNFQWAWASAAAAGTHIARQTAT